MKKLLLVLMFISLSAFAGNLEKPVQIDEATRIEPTTNNFRLICVDGKVVQEFRPDQVYTNDNLQPEYSGKEWKVFAKDSLPSHDYIEQLRCSGKNFTADKSIKPDFIVKREMIEAKKAELDAELAKDSPDPVKVIRANREIDKLRNLTK